MSSVGVLQHSYHEPFVRIFFKRRESGGDYEASWQTVASKYIKQVGSIGRGIDDIKINSYQYTGFNFTLDNSDGKWADPSDAKSFWYQYLTRYRTLVKVEAGYVDPDDGSEFPTNTTQFIGLLSEKIEYRENNLFKLNAWHMSKIFQETPASNIVGMSGSQTASELIANIKNHTQGSDTKIFEKYISTGGWNIETTTQYYDMATNASLEGINCWDFMKKLAEAEDKLLYMDRTGDFYFTSRSETAATPQYHFSGVGDTDNTYGKNIIKGGLKVDENIKQVYNRIRIKYDKPETSASYYIKQETWDWNDSSSSFYYGERTYEYTNEWLEATTAETIGDNLYSTYRYPKEMVKLRAKFIPHLEINDNISVTYKTQYYSGDALWGKVLYGHAVWGERSGKNINIDNKSYIIENVRLNLSKFTTDFQLKENV